VLAERRADRRRRVRLPARDLQLDRVRIFFAMIPTSVQLLDLIEPSSTGTWRSKMSTSTFSFCWSAFTSTISPSKSDSGPEVTFTDSPRVNSTCERRAAPAAAAPVCRIRSTSPCASGTGFAPRRRSR
jgi:hypothetical protein